MNPLVSPQWIANHPDSQRLVLLDASMAFQLPFPVQKDEENVIPGARRFDYDTQFCDTNNPLPHMMPSDIDFNQKAQQLGLNNDSIIVVYDNQGTLASPRAWWMFTAMGHQETYILDGGLTAWKEEGYGVVQHYSAQFEVGNFSGINRKGFVDADYIEAQIPNQTSLTIDARSQDRFLARVPEPREGVRSGHIPNSVCLPFMTLLDGYKMANTKVLNQVISEQVAKGKDEYLFSCGSGVTACIVLLAAHLCGYSNLSVYDGSWTEWGTSQRPISR
ncbi:sulfurtransferase [Vibrio sonorensis]|uniref:sulfurtransferase n=1 Tax=Vibrio sonorensis TaxID=1004316 RepID=UPI0008DA9698|nr:sulfurtransferase [Vibrio sonorensis]